MRKGYLFIANSTKPSRHQQESLEPIVPGSFEKSSIWAANEMGWSLHMGVNRNHPESIESVGYDIQFYNQNSFRNIFAIRDNWKAYRNLCEYLKSNPNIEIIHCNTPIGGLVGRLAGKKYNKTVIYTAHGFHFYKGASLFNRTILKWIERWLAHYTDIIITINEEDFNTAKQFRLKANGKVVNISGVGIDTALYLNPHNRIEVRKILNLSDKDFVCICMGDMVKRKNYKTAIESIAYANNKRIKFLICGRGPEEKKLKELAKRLNIEDQIYFLGFRKDIKNLLFASDCFLFSSLQEGLPRSTMEAMACGLPCIVSDIRGNKDLIDDQRGGFLVHPIDAEGFANSINQIIDDTSLCRNMSKWNLNRIKEFDIEKVKGQMYNIFKSILE